MWGALVATFVAIAAAVPTAPNVVHEKRHLSASPQYLKAGRVDGSAIVPVRIGLTQSNLERGYDHLIDISHPSSQSYGKHWTSEQVAREFAPSSDSVNAVFDWLATLGVDNARRTDNKGWIALDMPAAKFEWLFAAELHEYQGRDGSIHVGCDQYSVPPSLAPHVDYVTPGVKLSPPMAKSVLKRDDQHWGPRPYGAPNWHQPQPPKPHHWGPWHPPPGTDQLPPELRACGMNITPPCIRALYDIPFPPSNIDPGILGIFEEYDKYSQENLNQYFDTYAPYVPQGTHPDLVSINNATAPTSKKSAENGGESDVDFDIAFSLLGNVPITLYQAQLPSGIAKSYTGSQIADPLLAAVDGSYCDEELSKAGFQCGGITLSTVVSISYGLPEVLNSYKALQRACNEFMKLSLQGHTFVVASGDYGVAGNPESTSPTGSPCDSDGCIPRVATDGFTSTDPIFNPNFPQSCPYVLSVGATQLNSNNTVRDPESAMFQPDDSNQHGVCKHVTAFFGSSGGFSNYFSQPSYQKTIVSQYFAQHDPGYPYYELHGAQMAHLKAFPGNGIYNRAGRAFPDVSANGAQFNIFVKNLTTQEAGTSLAAPIWSSILAQINQDRKDAGKGPVGFVNPVLYANPSVFHDIANGTNPGCGTDGFAAVEGWDPITGLGTPDYPALSKLFLGLQ